MATLHSFTNPEADGSGQTRRYLYSEKTDKRSWAAMRNFFQGEVRSVIPNCTQ